MSRDNANAFASQVVQWLSALDVEAIQAHEDVRNALLDLVDRSKTLREEVAVRLKANKPPRENKDPNPIANYLARQAYSGPASRDSAITNMTKALNCLRSNLSIPIEEHQPPGTEEVHPAPFGRGGVCRQEKVMHRFRKHERSTNVIEGLRRLWLLRVSYEVDLLLLSVQQEKTDKSDVAAAEREFSRLSGEPIKVVRRLREAARPYLTLANRKNGLGILLMLGSQSRDLWENRVGDAAIRWLWMFCEANEQQVTERAEALQPIACGIVFEDFSGYDAHPRELRQEGHVFSRHFRQTEDHHEPPAGLQALVAAADVAVQDQMRSTNSGFATDIPAHDQMDEVRFQHQFSGTVENMTGTAQQAFDPTLLPHWQPGPGLEAAEYGFNPAPTPSLHDFQQTALPTVGNARNWDYDNFFMNWGYD